MPDETALANDLRIAVARISRNLRSRRADETINFPHFSALGTLLKHQPLTLQELAEYEGITPPSMLKTVNALEEHGYIERTPHETDGRKLLISITDDGNAMLDETRRQRNELLSAKLDELSADERASLRDALPLLQKLAGC